MFTGIIDDIGEVISVAKTGDTRLRIACAYDPSTIAMGASIACSGICLTVIARGEEGGQRYFDVEASAETAAVTTLNGWETGTRLNLERALKLGDELGGHMMSGHVDAVATLGSRKKSGASEVFTFDAPSALLPFIAPKGSIGLDGTSLTVNTVEGARFSVNLIPHTLGATVWGGKQPGAPVNIEIDMLARYVARILDQQGAGAAKS